MQTISLTYDGSTRSLTASTESAGTVVDNNVRFEIDPVEGAVMDLVFGVRVIVEGKRTYPFVRFDASGDASVPNDILARTSGTLPVYLRIAYGDGTVEASQMLNLRVFPLPEGVEEAPQEFSDAIVVRYASWAWNASVPYALGAVVTYNGALYVSLTDGNVGHTPAQGSEWWNTSGGDEGYVTEAELREAVAQEASLREAADATKQNTLTGAQTSIASQNLSASKALVSDADGKVGASAVSADELGRLVGVRSSVQDQIDGKQATLTFDNAPTAGSSNPVSSDGISTALGNKQDRLTIDQVPTENSPNPVSSGGSFSAIGAKQDRLTAGDGIVIQNNIITATGVGHIDDAMSDSSEFAVQNKVVKAYVDGSKPTVDTQMSDSSVNAVQNKVVKAYVDRSFTEQFTPGDTVEYGDFMGVYMSHSTYGKLQVQGWSTSGQDTSFNLDCMGYWIEEVSGNVNFNTVVALSFNYVGSIVTIQGINPDGTLGTVDFPLSQIDRIYRTRVAVKTRLQQVIT